MSERFFLYDDTVDTKTRFISFMGENLRYDLALLKTDKYYGKTLVLDIQKGKFAILGEDDLEEPGYLEHVYDLNEEDAEELRNFLQETIL
jgi:hypothetical protein